MNSLLRDETIELLLRARTENRGSDSDHRCAFFNGHFKIVAHAHRKFRQNLWTAPSMIQLISNFAQASKITPCLFWRIKKRRQRHQSNELQMLRSVKSFENCRQVCFIRAGFRWL